jgi:hypothetical protein
MEIQTIYKAEKGLIKITATVEGNAIGDIRITGDFFMIPEEAITVLEKWLNGVSLERGAVTNVLDEFYSTGVVTPSASKEDFVNAVMQLSPSSRL